MHPMIHEIRNRRERSGKRGHDGTLRPILELLPPDSTTFNRRSCAEPNHNGIASTVPYLPFLYLTNPSVALNR